MNIKESTLPKPKMLIMFLNSADARSLLVYFAELANHFDLYGNKPAASGIAHFGVECRDFIGDITLDSLKEFDIIYLHMIDESTGKYRSFVKENPRHLKAMKQIAEIAYNGLIPLIVSLLRLSDFKEWVSRSERVDKVSVWRYFLSYIDSSTKLSLNLANREDPNPVELRSDYEQKPREKRA